MVSKRGKDETLDIGVGETQTETAVAAVGIAATMDAAIATTIGVNQLHSLQRATHSPLLPSAYLYTLSPNMPMNQSVFSHLSSQVQPQYPSGQLHLHTPLLPSVCGRLWFHAPLSFDPLQQLHVHGIGVDQVHNRSRVEVGESLSQSKPTDLPMHSKNLQEMNLCRERVWDTSSDGIQYARLEEADQIYDFLLGDKKHSSNDKQNSGLAYSNDLGRKMVQKRIEERLELIDQEIVVLKKEIGKMPVIELSLNDIMKNLEVMRSQSEKQQQMLMLMMESFAKDRTAASDWTTESAARESAIAKGKESEATWSKSTDSDRNS
ncbi:transposon Tf2-1 polyprotein isoform X1 [Cucumis melo var. makuwa]|uniref:Transposon Tf2-1 polyprotein isoform X1 n=1 Tax=Cucumis melo var. makuwa TaxID=1194695 RepID=A0A5D3DKB1_CUCMM|nr:transposon Tf2-1 polyprotein isoform X1 [Cucumis melo var. makuwa]